MDRVRPDERKFQELVLYTAEKSASDPTFGATKLNKILFFSDFLSYARLGRPVTGVEYQRLQHGPAPRRLKPLQRELIEKQRATLIPVSYGYTQQRLIALDDADLGGFAGSEIALIDSVIEMLREHNATGVSELSHTWSIAWQSMRDGDTIPYETVFWGSTPPTPEIQALAEDAAKAHQLID